MVKKLRKLNKRSFQELVSQNKQELLNDKKAMEKIELKLDQKIANSK